MHVYRVQSGDTLATIASKYHVTPEQLTLCNDLPATHFVLPGQSLFIPSGMKYLGTDGFFTYQVAEGETLRDLCERFKIPVTWLAFCNLLQDNSLRSGDVLLVPHTDKRTRQAPPAIQLLSFDESTTTRTHALPRTHQGVRGLRVDASGRLHVPAVALGSEPALFFCTLDGPRGILPEVAKAILRSEPAQQQILEEFGSHLPILGALGIIFDWQEVRADCHVSYLAFIKEAGRRLRPMGLQVGLSVPADSAWQTKMQHLDAIAPFVDHLFYEPRPLLGAADGNNSLYPAPPSPLSGLGEIRRALSHATDRLPSSKIWLVNRPVGVICKQGQVLETISPHQALQLAYHQGAPLIRDGQSELVWFRTREGGCTVWFEDLWSFVRKLELLNQMNLQGLAMWESGGYFPEAWSYLHEYFELE